MKLAISLGSYLLTEYCELQLRWLRRVFGDVPILVCDGASENSERISNIADHHGAYYIGEEVNRGHFAGDIQNTVCALQFARDQGCDIALKLNQRFLLVHPGIRSMVANIFENPVIDVALPGSPLPHKLFTSKFFAKFPYLVDAIFMRVGKVDPDMIISRYNERCAKADDKFRYYVEILWADMLSHEFKQRHAVINALTDHQRDWPCFYLRKCQNNEGDYREAAAVVGMSPNTRFLTSEWSLLKKNHYAPFPRT
jgi:hypothetical protein